MQQSTYSSQDHPNLEETHHYCLLCDLLTEDDEGSLPNDNHPVSAEPSTTGTVGSNPTPRTIENVLTLVSVVWVVGCLILLEGLSLLFVVVCLSFFRVVRLVGRGMFLGV
jgi:beta-lactamase regulating signal transducer with metallopeptidase domain